MYFLPKSRIWKFYCQRLCHGQRSDALSCWRCWSFSKTAAFIFHIGKFSDPFLVNTGWRYCSAGKTGRLHSCLSLTFSLAIVHNLKCITHFHCEIKTYEWAIVWWSHDLIPAVGAVWIRAGYHQVTVIRYFSHNKNNIRDNWCIAINSIPDTSPYLWHWRHSELKSNVSAQR